MLAAVAFWVIFAAFISVVIDYYTYPQRQAEWEAKHPGATYQVGYKRQLRKEARERARSRKMKGVL